MAKPRWDIRAQAARMIGNRTTVERLEYIKIRSRLREMFPEVDVATIRSALGWVQQKNYQEQYEKREAERKNSLDW